MVPESVVFGTVPSGSATRTKVSRVRTHKPASRPNLQMGYPQENSSRQAGLSGDVPRRRCRRRACAPARTVRGDSDSENTDGDFIARPTEIVQTDGDGRSGR